MIKFSEAQQQAKQELNWVDSPEPYRIYKWVAYKNGAVVGESKVSHNDAISKYGTNLVERIWVNEAEWSDFRKKANALEQRAVDIWYDALRREYGWMKQTLFNICYDEAYDRGHAWGYDEVATHMDNIVDFVSRVLERA